MKKHQKHTKLTKPNIGNFGRNEFAILGTTCGNVKQMAFQWIEGLKNNYKTAYVDADHKGADQETEQGLNQKTAMGHGAFMEYTDKINRHRFETHQDLNKYNQTAHYNEADLIFINGNHFKAARQIVVIDPKKESSLLKRLDQLENVVLILLTEQSQDIYPFVKDKLEGKLPPVIQLHDVEGILSFLKNMLEENRPLLYGLVLAGGKSTRMGKDKGLIDYHGIPQREYAAQLLKDVCEKVFISCRADQLDEIESDFDLLPDSFIGLGPYGAILSAFRHNPNAAWLVVACDIPLVDKATIQHLVSNRSPQHVATAFKSPVSDFPEPLITIWEPKSYATLFHFLSIGYSCPRKALINSDTHILEVKNQDALLNVNSPEDLEKIKNKL